jgi:hypothetical protein
MNSYKDMVKYDQWSNMTMSGVPEIVLTALPEEVKFERLLFAEGYEGQAILQENCPLAG